jgi:uncharacterized repeat protein (TIGR03803 family)
MFGPFRLALTLAAALSVSLPAIAHAQTFQQLFVLPSGTNSSPAPDGALPISAPISQGNYLYVTNSAGGLVGASGCGFSNGCGSVIQINAKTGAETTLYEFCTKTNCSDGAHPMASLTYYKKAFYGTTEIGGSQSGFGAGTIFKLTQKKGVWKESVLYAFCASGTCADGNNPSSSLVFDKSGMIYGTTAGGAPEGGYGTVFKFDPSSGVLTTLYTFSGGTDGGSPFGGVIFGKDGALYGTTAQGGAYGGCGTGAGTGTVFRLDPTSQAFSTLFSFPTQNSGPCAPDGLNPMSALVMDKQGNFYGTTGFGGANNYGVVFKLQGKAPWTTTVLYNFCGLNNCADGYVPNGPLVMDKSGKLYGTTGFGGSNAQYSSGSVFQLDPSTNVLTTYYGFVGTHNGSYTTYANGTQPMAGLDLVQSGSKITLYGTTEGGGSTSQDSCYVDYIDGCGTVFAVTP